MFRVDYQVPSGREFGQAFLGQENLAVGLVAAGLAKVREGRGKGEEEGGLEQALKDAEAAAREARRGLWGDLGSDGGVRTIPAGDADAAALLAAHKGQTVRAVVEQVGSGSAFRVTLLPGFEHVPVFVAGLQCPSMGRRAAAEGAEGTPPDAWGAEAKQFTELRILSREVHLQFQGVDKFGNLFATVLYPAGGEGGARLSLGEQLLSHGLAKCVEWALNMVGPQAAVGLRRAQSGAQQAQRCLWRGYVAPAKNTAALSDNYRGRVVEVVSGDTLMVRDLASKVARRVQLSSLRAPRTGNRAGKGYEPWANEAKEFLRSKLIGRDVQVSMEYTREIPPPTDEATGKPVEGAQAKTLEFGTVKLPTGGAGGEGANVAEMLLVRGLATCVKHRSDDDRSAFYDDLLEAEAKAMKDKKGQHGSKAPPAARVNDVSGAGMASKAKQFLPFLQRSGRVSGIVEYAFGGHRFKVYCPKDSVAFTFALAAVRCPGRGEPVSDEAQAFAREHLLQRDVEVEVEDMDRNGAFLGTLHLRSLAGRGGYACALVGAGLATVFERAVSAGSPLVQAQKAAQEKQLGVWANWSQEEADAQAAARAQTAQTNKEPEKLALQVSQVLGGGRFYAQKASAAAQLQQITKALEDFGVAGPPSGPPPATGASCLGKFSADGKWYRAIIQGKAAGGKLNLFYTDFGNGEAVSPADVRPMPVTLAAAPHQAFLCRLAGVKVPSFDDDYGPEAAQLLYEIAGSGQTLEAAVYDREADPEGGKGAHMLCVSLADAESKKDVGLELVKEGLARMERRGRGGGLAPGTAEGVPEAQERAQKGRMGIWRYGDVGSDDEDAPRGWGR